ELETDKVAMVVAAPAAGRLSEIIVPEGTDVEPGALLGHIDPQASTPATSDRADASPPPAQTDAGTTTAPRPRLSPLVKRLLKLHELDPEDIPGTGAGGRIRRDDVLAYLDRRTEPAADRKST